MNGTTGIGLDWSGLIGLLIIAGIFGYGNGFGFGGNNAVSTLTNAELQMGLYNQTTDNAIRGISSQVATLNDTVLMGKYDNALLMKDASQQLSNSIASIGNLVVQENQATRDMIMQNKIDSLSDTITILRGENSNLKQTAEITQNILGSLATTAPKPPCYYGYGCGCNSLY
jgi:hypothetical protein